MLYMVPCPCCHLIYRLCLDSIIMLRHAGVAFVLRMCRACAYGAATAVVGGVGREAHFYVSVLLNLVLCCACAVHMHMVQPQQLWAV